MTMDNFTQVTSPTTRYNSDVSVQLTNTNNTIVSSIKDLSTSSSSNWVKSDMISTTKLKESTTGQNTTETTLLRNVIADI
ncbi:hypothetical protein KUTeg_014525 [Tegillarca granosa]|uniref:Uncharacterized protein n=1 Tax=Tegillarca granosa TaxID=220873 RepID=A0ABQ9ERY8_TEGGR|nr:hypothetical protein KUTeg_014525 [Tegillarca granosa]